MTFDVNAFVGGAIRVKKVRILPPASAHLQNELDDLVAEMDRAVLSDAARGESWGLGERPAIESVSEAVLSKRDEIESAQVEFTVRRLGAKAWADLVRAHPPTREQSKRQPGLDHNPDTFPVAAVAATMHDPELSADDVRRLYESLDTLAWETLVAAAVDINRGGGDDPKVALAGRILRLRDASETTPADLASHGQSS